MGILALPGWLDVWKGLAQTQKLAPVHSRGHQLTLVEVLFGCHRLAATKGKRVSSTRVPVSLLMCCFSSTAPRRVTSAQTQMVQRSTSSECMRVCSKSSTRVLNCWICTELHVLCRWTNGNMQTETPKNAVTEPGLVEVHSNQQRSLPIALNSTLSHQLAKLILVSGWYTGI